MKLHRLLVTTYCLMTLSPFAARAQVTFTLEEHAPDVGMSIAATPGTTNILHASSPSVLTATLSQSGLSASPSGSSGFTYLDNNGGGIVAFGNNLSNTIVGNAGDGTALETLTLNFSQAVTGVTFQFVTFPAAGGVPIELNATTNTGVSVSNSGVSNGATGNGEGSITLSGNSFQAISLSLNRTPVVGGVGATVGDTFLVDNFIVVPFNTPAVMPEPGSVALLATSALTGAGFLMRRRTRVRKGV